MYIRQLLMNPTLIDDYAVVNMGCPKKFSVSGGMGSALLSDPDRASRIIKALRSEIPRPISCKIRLLKDTSATLDYMEAMINAGAQAIAVHARRVGDEATKPADWASLQEVFELIRPKYPNIPFLINGDFYDREETQDILDKTKANGVLLGRPALYNTSIFRPIHEPLEDKTKVVQEYVKQAVRYDIHHKNAKYVICEMMSHRRTPTQRVPYLPQKFPDGQNTAKTCNCHSMEAMCQLWNVNFSASQYSTEASCKGDALDPGEHRYEDDYFLKHEKLDQQSFEVSSPNPKKARLQVEEEKKC
jgi:tRNA-dihydrouridine synthase